MGTTCSATSRICDGTAQRSLPPADAPEYKEKQKEFIARITAEYTSKPEYWLTVYEDIRKTFLTGIAETILSVNDMTYNKAF